MVKSFAGIRSIIFLSVLYLSISVVSALQICENVDEFRISFDSRNDTNVIIKFLNISGAELDDAFEDFPIKITKIVGVMAGTIRDNDSDSKLVACLIFVLQNPVNSSNITLEDIITGYDSDNKYIRVFDRVIDGHKAILLEERDMPSDPSSEYVAIYWLDEANGEVNKLVLVMSTYPENETERFLSTIHVEEIVEYYYVPGEGMKPFIPVEEYD